MRANGQNIRNMGWQKRKDFAYIIAFVLAAFTGVFMVSCSKQEVEKPPRVDTIPLPPSAPTGKIEYFTVQDTLVGYRRQTTVKWYVTGTNSKTIVLLNGIPMKDFQGGLFSGPLTTTSVFTLSVNNGLQQTRTVKVADSITTFLWNEGKGWITNNTRTETDVMGKSPFTGNDTLLKVWMSYYDDAAKEKYRLFRTFFYLDGRSEEKQGNSAFPKPNPTGNFSILVPWLSSHTGFAIHWKKTWYAIDTMSAANRELVVTFDSSLANRQNTHNRIRYISEF